MEIRSLSWSNIAASLMLVFTTAAMAVPADTTTEQLATEFAAREDGRPEAWSKPPAREAARPLREFAQGKETCLLVGEERDGKMKFCFYSCPSGKMFSIVRASVCPGSYEK